VAGPETTSGSFFVFDTRRLRPSGLAGELVVALEEETDVTATDLERQFARTPYAVSFTTGREELTLVVLHVIWGDNEAERVPEPREIAAWLADWPRREEMWSKNLVALGDFNVDRGPLYDALTATGLTTPAELNNVPRTIFESPTKTHFYDQIAWFAENGNRSVLSLGFLSAGTSTLSPCSTAASPRISSRGRSLTITRSGSSSRFGRQFRDS
jgi:hypothetical protein